MVACAGDDGVVRVYEADQPMDPHSWLLQSTFQVAALNAPHGSRGLSECLPAALCCTVLHCAALCCGGLVLHEATALSYACSMFILIRVVWCCGSRCDAMPV